MTDSNHGFMYRTILFTKTASETGLKIYDWQRWQLGHTCTICNICQTLCTGNNLCEYSYNNMVQSHLRWTMTPTMSAWMTVPHCCIAVTLVFVVSSSQQQQQHTVSQGRTVAADKLPTLTLTVTVSSRDSTAELVAYYVLWTESVIQLLWIFFS